MLSLTMLMMLACSVPVPAGPLPFDQAKAVLPTPARRKKTGPTKANRRTRRATLARKG